MYSFQTDGKMFMILQITDSILYRYFKDSCYKNVDNRCFM
jgi:hypothetical protein